MKKTNQILDQAISVEELIKLDEIKEGPVYVNYSSWHNIKNDLFDFGTLYIKCIIVVNEMSIINDSVDCYMRSIEDVEVIVNDNEGFSILPLFQKISEKNTYIVKDDIMFEFAQKIGCTIWSRGDISDQ